MKQITRLALLSITLALLAGCETSTQTPVTQQPLAPAVDAACTVTSNSWAHISARHCAAVPPPGADQFTNNFCTQAAQQNICQQVQNAPNKTRVVQPDNRIRYDANLGVVVGTNAQKCVRLITESATNGTVVTQFPELAGAPGNCQ